MLPEVIAQGIKSYLEKWWKNEGLKHEYPNVILKTDVLSILDRYCTVIYYPLEDERNNGFHLQRYSVKDKKNIHFVFLNSAQSIEKQVFTAAHELAHVCKVDESICESYKIDMKDDIKERIANRFAAELLMREDIFKIQFKVALESIGAKDGKISLPDFIKVVVFLMNVFIAPMKAVMVRFAEVGILDIETINMILTDEKLRASIDSFVERIILEEGYIELKKGTQKKWIEGLAELLDKADNVDDISENKINSMREAFDIQKPITNKCDELPPETTTVTFAEGGEWKNE